MRHPFPSPVDRAPAERRTRRHWRRRMQQLRRNPAFRAEYDAIVAEAQREFVRETNRLIWGDPSQPVREVAGLEVFRS